MSRLRSSGTRRRGGCSWPGEPRTLEVPSHPFRCCFHPNQQKQQHRAAAAASAAVWYVQHKRGAKGKQFTSTESRPWDPFLSSWSYANSRTAACWHLSGRLLGARLLLLCTSTRGLPNVTCRCFFEAQIYAHTPPTERERDPDLLPQQTARSRGSSWSTTWSLSSVGTTSVGNTRHNSSAAGQRAHTDGATAFSPPLISLAGSEQDFPRRPNTSRRFLPGQA